MENPAFTSGGAYFGGSGSGFDLKKQKNSLGLIHYMARENPGGKGIENMHITMNYFNLAAALCVFASSATEAETLAPPFSDTAGTVFDIIQKSDPTALLCVENAGRGARQIWDKRVDNEPVVNAFLFMARYSDGSNIEIAINPEFGSQTAALAEALRYAGPLGQLPTSLRAGIERFSVHDGRKSYHAGTGQIVVYAETTDNRLGYNHLEESLFHESVHASWDAEHRLADGWVRAQKADGRFLTGYGENNPEREDLAETALFAYAILHHPDRFPPADTRDTLAAVPARMAYIEALLPRDAPIHYSLRAPISCTNDISGQGG